MVKDIAIILKELGINLESETLLEDITNKLLEYSVVSENELLGIQSVSVQPLPTIIKNNEKNLKQRMVGIVSDQEKGAVSIINKRTVLLTKIIEALKNKVESFTDLGEINTTPTSEENDVLNNIKTKGVYSFNWSGFQYIMLVHTNRRKTPTGFITVYEQYITSGSVIINRTSNSSTDNWETNSESIAFSSEVDTARNTLLEKIYDYHTEALERIDSVNDSVNAEISTIKTTKADKTYVNDKFNQLLGEGASETLDTIGEISKALDEHNDEYDSLLSVVGSKADKNEVPNKLSQLEIDMELGVNEEDVLEIVEKNSHEVEALNIGTSEDYDLDSDYEVPTTKAVSKIISGKKTYTLPLGEPTWLRIAKIEEGSNTAGGIITVVAYGVKEDVKTVLTSSTFSINYATNEAGEPIIDVTPLGQVPEIKGSDVSGDGSGGGSGDGSGGSGASGSHGLVSVCVEEYGNDTYICGLMNFPATDKFTELEMETSLYNNINIVALDSVEPVDLTEVNEESQQVLEGYTLNDGEEYEWRITTTLGKLVDGLKENKSINFSIQCTKSNGMTGLFYPLLYGSGAMIIPKLDGTMNTISPSNYPNDLVNTEFPTEADFSMYNDVMPEIRNCFSNELGILPENVKINFKITGDFVFDITGQAIDNIMWNENGNTGYIEITGDIIKHHVENLEPNVYLVFYSSPQSPIRNYFELDPYNTEIEIVITNKMPEGFTISSYEIANNDVYDFKFNIAHLTRHIATDSYNLFSQYNVIEKIKEDMSVKKLEIMDWNYGDSFSTLFQYIIRSEDVVPGTHYCLFGNFVSLFRKYTITGALYGTFINIKNLETYTGGFSLDENGNVIYSCEHFGGKTFNVLDIGTIRDDFTERDRQKKVYITAVVKNFLNKHLDFNELETNWLVKCSYQCQNLGYVDKIFASNEVTISFDRNWRDTFQIELDVIFKNEKYHLNIETENDKGFFELPSNWNEVVDSITIDDITVTPLYVSKEEYDALLARVEALENKGV